MYLAKNKHLISNILIIIAIVNLFGEGVNSVTRMLVDRSGYVGPDMFNETIWRGQLITFAFRILVSLACFIFAFLKIREYRKLIPREDEEEMAKLQREMNPKGISTLTLTNIEQLLIIWSGILVGASVVYELTSVAYRKFIGKLTILIAEGDVNEFTMFMSIYNGSHGFKYIGLITAITIGILTTGVFLKDRFLVILSIVVSLIFLTAFLLMENSVILFASKTFGVVWTSVIFHLIETLGLFGVAIYLRVRYRGM